MVEFDLVLKFPAGVMVSGYSAVTDGLHGETAMDRHGKPVVPATAIRGALREALEALLRGAGQGACDGGSGVAPVAPNGMDNPQDTGTSQKGVASADPVTPEPDDLGCALGEGGQRCVACRIFGTRRRGIGADETYFSALVIGNAELSEGSQGWMHRPGVAIDRRLRSAANDLLFLQRTAGGGREFRARGRLLDDSLLASLQAAVMTTSHIGAGKSRGLARVNVDLVPLPSEAAAHAPRLSLPPGEEAWVRFTLDSPASIGEAVNEENAFDTRRHIPGSALRGTVGFALAEVLPSPNQHTAFQDLVAENGAQFGFLFPVDEGSTGLAAPLPITAIWCKRDQRSHGLADTLLDRIAAHAATTVEEAERVSTTSTRTCPKCLANPRGARGHRRLENGLALRAVTRAASDRRLRSAKDEALFTQVLLETGARFEGRIRNISDDKGIRALLEQALSSPLSVGRGRGAGWGRVTVEVRPPPSLKALSDRKTDFDAALGARFAEIGASFGQGLLGRIVPVTLLAPLWSKAEAGDGTEELMKATGATGCFLRARRFTREGGWDQRAGRMEPALTTAAGGVFVLEFPTKEASQEALPALADLEKQGAGERRYQGYGEVVCFDPFHLQRRFS